MGYPHQRFSGDGLSVLLKSYVQVAPTALLAPSPTSPALHRNWYNRPDFWRSGSMFIKLIQSVLLASATYTVFAADELPISDVHVHYSHDSVEQTPPERVIELMREANLKFALVSSSDDRGTQLLSELAPDLIVPGLRPYSRRGQTSTWFKNPEALAYVESLLEKNRYASIGEFHLYGSDADLEIPRRIVQLADEYNLILHAHSDADAVERLLAQSDSVRVIWAHSGFDSPEDIANLLRKHDRLMADLAFRSDVGSGGTLEEDWVALFTEFPDRMMLGTDTYTPERIHFIPLHANASRAWLSDLPLETATRVAWKNAFDFIMPVWMENNEVTTSPSPLSNESTVVSDSLCDRSSQDGEIVLADKDVRVRLQPRLPMVVSEPISLQVTVCGPQAVDTQVTLDATMPAHGHGMNYKPEQTVSNETDDEKTVQVEGIVLHMPGQWRWFVELELAGKKSTLTHDFLLD